LCKDLCKNELGSEPLSLPSMELMPVAPLPNDTRDSEDFS